MNPGRISWLDQDESVLRLNPMERLMLSTEWVSQRPEDEPWVAVAKPADLGCRAFVLSLSLDGYHEFSEEIRERFIEECEVLISQLPAEEIQEVREIEIANGNRGDLVVSSSRLLRLVISADVREEAKQRIQDLFAGFEETLVVESQSD